MGGLGFEELTHESARAATVDCGLGLVADVMALKNIILIPSIPASLDFIACVKNVYD